ncbi:MAG: DUF1127 domain-containing protein [Pseudomonadota bacterium]
MAMTEFVQVSARRAPFGAITIYKIISAVSAPFVGARATDMRAMSPAVREDLGVTLADVDTSEQSLVARVTGWVKDAWLHRSTVAQLSALTDRQLDDIGISRADIHKL